MYKLALVLHLWFLFQTVAVGMQTDLNFIFTI